jgi:enamine deaminase RidA (YjgF/YER057c/UK114 family)
MLSSHMHFSPSTTLFARTMHARGGSHRHTVRAVFLCAQAAASRARAITRLGTDDARMSQIVMCDGMVTLSGQVPEIDKLATSDSEFIHSQ